MRSVGQVLLALFVTVEAALVGGWAASGATLLFVLLQFPVAAVAALVWVVRRYLRHRRVYEEGIADAAAVRERMLLAEEMHDTVGHELSVVALRVSALQVRATGPEREQLAALRKDVETAVIRLRDTVRVLRDGAPEPYEPGATSIDQLLARARSSGAVVDVEGRLPKGLPLTVESVAGRVVREGLTNACRHAPTAPITLRLDADDACVRLRMSNALTSPPSAGDGSGLAALRRRLTVVGGTLTAGDEDGEYVVTATIPLQAPTPAAAAALPPRVRRPWRATARSAAAPAALSTGLVLAFYALATTGATMEPAQQARVVIGAPEARAAGMLPSREAIVRLMRVQPHPSNWQCRYYTDGNFPLGMATYEVCFDRGAVARTADLRRTRPW